MSNNRMGYLKHRKDGRLELRVNYVDEKGLKKSKSFYGHSEEECYNKAEEFTARNEKRKDGIDVDATVVEIIRAICDDDFKIGDTGEQGYSRNMSSLDVIKKNYVGNVPIRMLTKEDVQQFRYYLSDNYHNSTIKKVYGLFKKGFKQAKKEKIIEIDLTEDLKYPGSKLTDKEVTGLSEEEQNKFVKYLEESFEPRKGRNNYIPQMLISLFTGLRIGEVNALKISDIDFKNNLINVNATISRGKDYRLFYKPSPKTKAGKRDVPLFEVVRDILIAAVEKAQKDKNPHSLLFYDKNSNKYISTQQVCESYKRICKKANIPYYGVHSLRHTFASRRIEENINPKTLQTWMGHSSIKITFDIYGDLFDKQAAREAEKVNNRYEGHYLKDDKGSKKGSIVKVRPIKRQKKR